MNHNQRKTLFLNIFNHSAEVLAANVIIATLLLYEFENLRTEKTIFYWFLTVILLSVIKYAAGYKIKSVLSRSDFNSFNNTYVIFFLLLVFLSGTLWGSISLLYNGRFSETDYIFLIFIMAGLLGGAIGTYSAYPGFFAAYSIPYAGLNIMAMLTNGGRHNAMMAVMIAVYAGIMQMVSFRVRKLINSSIELKETRDELSFRLRESGNSLARAMEEINAVFEMAPIGIVFIKDGKIIRFNQKFTELMGISKEEIFQMRPAFIDFLSIESNSSDEIAEEVKNLFFNGYTIFYELELTNQIYGNFWASLYGNLLDKTNPSLGSIWTIEDISKQKSTEMFLIENEKNIKSIIESIPIPIAVLSGSDEDVVFHNNLYFDLIKATGAGTFHEIFSNKNDRTIIQESISSMREIPEKEMEVLLENGTTSWKILNLKLFNYKNKPSLLAAVYDITSRKESEDKLFNALKQIEQTQGQLIQYEKMASLGQLVAGIAHEINNPVNFIHTAISPIRKKIQIITKSAENIGMKLPSGSEMDSIKKNISQVEELLDVISEGTERTKNIIKDMQNFSRKKEDELKTVQINNTIDSALNLIHNQFKDRIAIRKEFGENVFIRGNPGQINQVIINLITNAAQAITGQGLITVKTYTDANTAIIEISDTGTGIPSNLIPKIFDPFFTTKETGKGTGLGLSITYEIIKKHGGNIEVKSIENEGSTFTIQLPASGETI